MKGKGKGERKEEKRDKDKEDCPLQFPDLKPVDHSRQCPRYTAVLGRREEDSVGIEELDMLQTELETLLASAAKRMRQLESEINSLNNWQDKNKDKKVPPGKVPEAVATAVSPSGKRAGKGAAAEDKASKKFKDSAGKAKDTPTPTPIKPKGKVQQHIKVQEYEFPESPKAPQPPVVAAPVVATASTAAPSAPAKEIPRLVANNDAPNRFWSMVDPYCKEVTHEDLKCLEDLMRSHDDDGEYYKIPALGKHYSKKWAQEDLLEEQREGAKANKKGSKNNSGDAHSLLKRLEEGDNDTSPFGPLTQRLVQALIEENIMTPLDDTTISEADAVEAATISPRSLAKQLNLGNAAALERRIKRELEEQGILEIDDKPEDNPDDEILAELRKKQQELRALSQHNRLTAERLHKLAREEMQRQDLRKKMVTADAEVMDSFRKIQAARQKKKGLSKKEKDAAWKAMRDREALVKQLEALGAHT